MPRITEHDAGVTLGNAGDVLGFFGSRGSTRRSGSAQAAIGTPTYAAPSAVPADSTQETAPTTAEFNAALATLSSVRTQLIALAADLAAQKVRVNELRAALVGLNIIPGA